MNSCVVIPARFNSSRFQGKPIAKILGKEMIIHVAEACSKAISKNHIYIATDDERIRRVVEKNNYKCVITSNEHLTGTDRIAEVARKIDYEYFINVQGDEPMVNPQDILRCIELKSQLPNDVINGYTSIDNLEEFKSENVPKVVFDKNKYLLYISRSPIPGSKGSKKVFEKSNKQVCIYGFNKQELDFFSSFKKKEFLEDKEDIEILRFLENNKKIKMFKCRGGSIAVDTYEDLKKVEHILKTS